MTARVYIETYGCALAEFESCIMEEVLRARGFEVVSDISLADVIVVNTCAVRLDTEQKIAKRLLELRKSRSNARFVVTGCLAKARPGLVIRVVPEASLLAPQAVERVAEAVNTALAGSKLIVLDCERDTSRAPPLRPQEAVGTVMIQEGCLNECSFCITKLARPKLKSYPINVVVDMVRRLVEQGAVEIRLTGMDVGAYGADLSDKPTLADLLREVLDKVEGDYLIRIGMMTPESALETIDDLLDVYRDSRVYKYFHIPVQTGDDRLLKIMGRKYSVEDYKELYKKIKNRFPDAVVATDIIVGHPGEDEKSFEKTVELLLELRFEKVHIAQYTIRPHTKASVLPQVSDSVKKERSTKLSKLVESICYEKLSRYKSREVVARVVEIGFRKESLIARLENYVPVVLRGGKELLRKRVRVLIEDNTFFDLRGKVIEVLMNRI
ncbi:MAG: tRNA (N(6)-L-threonylcarbamoyladenosine(37)-C(2))-methylthiotransferase [Acidilobaceae archaeon]